ncbi:hypothetical protein PFMC_04914 [Plasmodium falciparum CAMP/Malaysia]|uniref:SKP1 component dimerisation domain-containing protein n=1 Tax=Plasmodium falciparum (isolate Camp / Malaysia) TaxID=5835 RepID=A0A024X350_PLAFC|nr:hypothetical protein PFMC_04914 [Plasmodium falciparum CAMP/Malaysia]
MMKDKTTEEIRAEFDIVNDFTREEEKQRTGGVEIYKNREYIYVHFLLNNF